MCPLGRVRRFSSAISSVCLANHRRSSSSSVLRSNQRIRTTMHAGRSTMSSAIVFDLETTGLGNCDIISIGAIAVDSSSGEEIPRGRYEGYIMPTTAINPGATKVNGFTKQGGSLHKNGIRVENAENPQEGLQKFVDFLSRMAGAGQIDLVAHNAFGFDGPVLRKNLNKFDVQYGTSIR